MTWVDFKQLRKNLDFEKVLALYGVTVKRTKGNRHQGFCPLPTHHGKRKTPSFSAKLDWGAWQCFGCGARGNILEFATRMEGFDPANMQDLRKVAVKLQERFAVQARGEATPNGVNSTKMDAPRPTDIPVVVNARLDFELKHLDLDHPYLLGRGFTPETIQHFGLGFCSKGLMKERIVIPLHDAAGNLVGYAGRVIDDKLISETNPRYRFPSGRERSGVYYDFQKSLLLYNGFGLSRTGKLHDVTIVESFTACWWIHQLGFQNVVGVMGSSCSSEQAAQIVSMTSCHAVVTILTDGDDAGVRCAMSIFTEVAPYRKVRWARLDTGRQPTDYDKVAIRRLRTL